MLIPATADEKVKAVQAYALEHYNEEGWDYLVECFEDAEIIKETSSCITIEQAIEAIRSIVRLLDERRREVMNEVF